MDRQVRRIVRRSVRQAVPVLALCCMALPASAQHIHDGASGLPHGIPDLCSSPTNTASAPGSYSNPAIWSAKRVPAAGDKVLIPAGTEVVFDVVSDQVVYCMSIKGTLRFRTDTNTRLTVGTMLVFDNATLQIGQPSAPIAPNVTAEVVFGDVPLDTGRDPEQFGTGLLGVGTVVISGSPQAVTFSRVTREPRAGDFELQVEDTLGGWSAGDRVILPDTRHLKETEAFNQYSPQWEELTVASVSGNTIRLTSGLRFNHLGARNGQGVVEFLPHVGNLSRNVIFRSANPNGVRGHTLFSQRATVDIRYALFKDMGRTKNTPLDCTRFSSGATQEDHICTAGSGSLTHIGTNQIGRYPIHLHHVMGPANSAGAAYQYTLLGNAVDGATKWGLTIHNSHYGLIRQNVVYNALGSSIVTEDGSESFNVIDRNFAVRTTGTGGRTGFGREGGGFWLRGPNNYVTNNVTANHMADTWDSAYGYKYFMYYVGDVRIPKFPGADTTNASQVDVRSGSAMPVLQFTDNEVYGATEAGMTYWWIGTQEQESFPNVPPSVFKGLKIWHVFNRGVYNYASNGVVLDGMVIRGATTAESKCCSIGFDFGDYHAQNLTIRNSDIQGMRFGIYGTPTTNGTFNLVEQSYLRNQINIYISTPRTVGATTGTLQMPRKMVLKGVRLETANLIPGAEQATIYRGYDRPDTGGTYNYVVRDELFVYDHNQVAGENFQMFYKEQRPDFVMPASQRNSDGSYKIEAAPAAGMTNQSAWNSHRVAIAGAVAPCTTERSGMIGYTCSTTVPPPDSGQSSSGPPAPPRNVRIVQ